MVSNVQDEFYPERTGQDSYEKYYGRRVVMLVDGRSCVAATTNESITLEAKIVGENKSYVELEDVKLYRYETEKYQHGTIGKQYIIGVFRNTEENK